MKSIMLAAFLISLAGSAGACDYFGTKGRLSDDGQRITSRQPIALKEQAALYGGYTEAASIIEKNRQDVLRNEHYSETVKRQVDQDLAANVKQLKCWAQVCSSASNDPVCHLH